MKPIEILLFLLQTMPPTTKTTPRKELKCPMCPYTTLDLGLMKEHLAECGIEKLEKRYSCSKDGCNYTTNRLANLNRHQRRHEETKSKESDGDWAQNDPGNLSDILGGQSTDSDVDAAKKTSTSSAGSDFVPIRKPTQPAKVFVPPQKPKKPTIGLKKVPSYALPSPNVPQCNISVPKATSSSGTKASSATVSSSALSTETVSTSACSGKPISTSVKPKTTSAGVGQSLTLGPTLEMPPRRMAANLHLPPMFALGRMDSTETKDTGTQTLQPAQKKTRWTITRWSENGRDFEEVYLVEDVFGAN